MPTLPPKPFAVGRTAEVYAWEDGTVLKLYRNEFPLDWVDNEARIGRVVCQAGIPAPEVRDVIEVQGRRGIVYERVDGANLLEVISRSPWKLVACAHILGKLHALMHRSAAPSLPDQRGGTEYAIRHAAHLPDDLRARALAALASLPEGDRLCHGDFHPGNVIFAARGPVVIDWMTARKGHPAADIARTRLILTIGVAPEGSVAKWLTLFGRRLLVSEYLRAYRAALGGEAREILRLADAFLPVMAAARLMEQIPPERERLLKIVEQAFAETTQ
jgi:aminoglycoside phosphotransferase (APT) family kinase protein